jgi:hypothetical protein
MFHLSSNKPGSRWLPTAAFFVLPYVLLVLSLFCGLSLALAAPAFMNNGLVAYYPFNGNANDESGFGNNAALLAGASLAEGRFVGSGAVRIDGVNGLNKGVRISTPLVNSGQPEYTINIWFKCENPDKYAQTLINSDPHTGIAIGYNGDLPGLTKRVGMGIGNGLKWSTTDTWSTNSFADVQWRMATMVKHGDRFSLFVDANLEAAYETATSEWSTPLSFWVGSIGPIFPGALHPGQVFAGILDDVRIYDRALSATEVGQLFAVESTDTPRKAVGTAQVVNGFFVGVELTDPGYGYTSAPAVRITGGGGSGATAIAVVENGVVTGVAITNPGSGYTGTPKVSIASPLFSPELKVAVSRVTVTSKVVLGLKYLLESSTDLQTWTTVGAPFVAESEELNQEYVVGETGQFFRITQVP